jgi:pyridinium-3,5-biscarboxylic acid mononucleotide sulfurtransferase
MVAADLGQAGNPVPGQPHRYGLEVTGSRLARVDRAETAVRTLLFSAGITVTDLRVRDLGDAARIELPTHDLPVAQAVPRLSQAVAQAGFAGAAVEYAAFSSGSLNKK